MIGIAGTVIPVVPGPTLVWAGIALYGFLDHFHTFSWYFLLAQAFLAAAAHAVDYFASAWGVRRFNGSRAAAWGAVLGSLLIFFAGPWGILIGPFAGAVVMELLMGREMRHAFRSGIGSFIGMCAGTFLKMFIVGIMVAWFLVAVSPVFF